MNDVSKIRRLSIVAFIVLLPYAIYYPWEAFNWQLEMAFLDPERWQNSRWAHPDVEIAWTTRAIYLAMWSSATICGVIGIFWAFRLILCFWRGIVFDFQVAAAIYRMGCFLVAANAVHIIAACFSPMIVSWHNPDGPLPLRFWYSSTHLGLILCGLGFVLMGAIMREAIRLARENDEFV